VTGYHPFAIDYKVLANSGSSRSATLAMHDPPDAGFTVNQVDHLTLNQPTLGLFNGAGGGIVSDSSTTLGNTGGASTTFTITTSTNTGGSWLGASAPTNTIAPGGSVGLTVTADTTQLNPGTYTGVVTVTGTSSLVQLMVSVNVSGVSISATSLVDFGTIQPQKQAGKPVTVTASGGQAQVAIAVNPGATWLTVSTATVTANVTAQFNVIVDATSYAPGSYSGTVTLQCTSSPCVEQFVTVKFKIAGVDKLGADSPVNLSNGSGAGIVTGSSKLTNTGNTATAFTITWMTATGGNWLSASSNKTSINPGETDVSITVTANTSQIPPNPPGTPFTGTVTITGATSSVVIQVTLTVNGVAISAAPSPINLGVIKAQKQAAAAIVVSAKDGGGGPSSAVFTVAAVIGAGQGSGWLTTDATSTVTASSSATFHYTVDASSLQPGNSYSANITLQCTAAPCVQVNIMITFTVASASTLNCPQVGLNGNFGWTPQVQQQFSIGTADGSTVPISFTGLPSWLQITPPTGNAGPSPTNFNAAGSLAQLPLGQTSANVTAQASSGGSPSCTLPVSASISSFAITPSPNPLSFTPVAGLSQNMTLTIATPNQQQVTVQAATTGDSGGNWLKTNTGSITAPGAFTVTANAAGLSGNHSGSVMLSCDSSTPCAAVSVPVTANISSSATLVTSSTLTFTSGPKNAVSSPQFTQVTASDNTTAISFTVAASSTGGWLQAASDHAMTPAVLTLSMSFVPPLGASGTVTLTPASGPPTAIAVTYTPPVPGIPAVTQVINAGAVEVANEPLQPGIGHQAYITIVGSDLTNGAAGYWTVPGNDVPTVTLGSSINIGGKPAYPYYVSPTQINAIAPGASDGAVQVVVSTASGSSNPFSVINSEYSPAFFVWPNNQVVATRQDYSLAVKDGSFTGLTTIAAKPGDILILWGTGFGPTIPPVADGILVPLNNTTYLAPPGAVTVLLNNKPCTVFGAALAAQFVGLYQVAIQVPLDTPNGDWPLTASVGGANTPIGLVLSVHN
jgi:uncharacterized protein (TIGR03437 family)